MLNKYVFQNRISSRLTNNNVRQYLNYPKGSFNFFCILEEFFNHRALRRTFDMQVLFNKWLGGFWI